MRLGVNTYNQGRCTDASCDMVTLHSISCVYIVCVCVCVHVCVCVFGGYKETKNKIKVRVQ